MQVFSKTSNKLKRRDTIKNQLIATFLTLGLALFASTPLPAQDKMDDKKTQDKMSDGKMSHDKTSNDKMSHDKMDTKNNKKKSKKNADNMKDSKKQ